MKETLSTYEIADRLHKDENGGWSYAGAYALAERLEEMEEDTGTELECDRVAIRCDFAEFDSLQDWASGYFSELPEEIGESCLELDDAIREYIWDHGDLIEFNGGIIVSSF